jgi:hypothetical protein
VLFVHYHFLPVHNVAVKRLLGYAKQLPAFGWQPLVLTREWHDLDDADPSWGLSWEPALEQDAGCTIYRVPVPHTARPRMPRGTPPSARRWPDAVAWGRLRRHADKLVAKVARMKRMVAGGYPDEFAHWVGPAVTVGIEAARTTPFDVVVSYCPPESNHVVARRLARRLAVPWVPFFADLYGFLDAPLPWYSVEGLLRRAWHRWCLAPAAACAAVSPYMVDYLAKTYRKPTELVLTGFDVDEPASPPRDAAPRPDRLVVSHVGSVYPDDQQPEILFNGLDRLLAQRPDLEPCLEVRFVGSKCDKRLRAMLADRPAARVCSIQPKVDSVTAASLVRESDGLLAFTCSMHRDRHGTLSYPTKIFEAFGARRPVLAIPADGDWVDQVLARTGGGVSARGPDDVAAHLLGWVSSWSRNGCVPYHGKPVELAAFSRRRQVERLAQLFDSVCRQEAL